MGHLYRLLRRSLLVIAAAGLFSTSVPAHPGSGIAVDKAGNVFFLDTGSGLWRIDAKGGLTHLSPLRNHWLAIDPNNGFTQPRLPTDSARDWVITSVGSDPIALVSTDFPVVIGQDGRLYYPINRGGSVQIMRMAPSETSSVFASLPRTVAGAPMLYINGITTGPGGSIYYSENTAIRRITDRGAVSTAATVAALAKGPSIPGTHEHPYLRGLAIDAKGVIYVADNGDARVLKITPDGRSTTLVQLESPWSPTAVALWGDVLYVLEFLHTEGDDRVAWMPRIRKITPDGKSTIILTVDQMPGARPKPAAKGVGLGLKNLFHFEFQNPFLG